MNQRPTSRTQPDALAVTIHDPLADAFRRWGYLQSDLDPMGRIAPFEHPDLADARGA